MRHVTHEWAMSHVNGSCQLWMSHVTCKWVNSTMNKPCHTCEWVMSHIWISHVTHMNESCHTYEWVMSHINESCHNNDKAMSRMHELLQDDDCVVLTHTRVTLAKCVVILMTVVKWLYLTYEWVMSRVNGTCHMWLSHVTYAWAATG